MSAAFSSMPLFKLGPSHGALPNFLCFGQSHSGHLYKPLRSPSGLVSILGTPVGSASALAFPEPLGDPVNYGLSSCHGNPLRAADLGSACSCFPY